jgi:hypothetical protein
MERDWGKYSEIWQAQGWGSLEEEMKVLGLWEEFRALDQTDDGMDTPTGSKWLALQHILSAFVKLNVDQGDLTILMKFTPQSLGVAAVDDPQASLRDWMEECAEEFIRSMVRRDLG